MLNFKILSNLDIPTNTFIMSQKKEGTPNRLIDATSPYLLQHAYNPVDWYPWGPEALAKAQEEDKPIIVSIGYSACHWCHVMERESFENAHIAKIMNDNFVCIKVDREERPDVDAIYMNAVQAMGMQGGWPLNAFLMPNTEPFYAGTYFPPRNWATLLNKITDIYQKNRQELANSAQKFGESIATSEVIKYGLTQQEAEFTLEDLDQMFEGLAPYFDKELGGMQKAPKFPMPSIYAFLLNYALSTENQDFKRQASQQVKRTLNAIGQGGIYDQIGGGFARYSVDAEWFAPHFEKMLYDNGQLISLYADAYALTKDEYYKNIVFESIEFVARELTSEEGGFYSALDADSEGEEGKFYIWTYEELSTILSDPQDLKLFCAYYKVSNTGNWEKGTNILYPKISEKEFAELQAIPLETLREKLKQWKKQLLEIRDKRIRPGLDDKILTSWNGLMLKGLVDAYRVFQEPKFLEMALQNAQFLLDKVRQEDQLLHSYKNGTAHIIAYLEDYASVIQAYTALYQATFDFKWLKEARRLAKYTIQNFYDAEENMFFFTDAQGEKLIARKKEIFDNVIPASNSMMAQNLYILGLLLDNTEFLDISRKMLSRVKTVMLKNIEYLANWGQLFTWMAKPTAEIAIIGEKYLDFRAELDQRYFPNKILMGSANPSDRLPLLENRLAIDEKTTLYVCFNKACQLPVHTVPEAWEQIQS